MIELTWQRTGAPLLRTRYASHDVVRRFARFSGTSPARGETALHTYLAALRRTLGVLPQGPDVPSSQ